MEIGWTELMVIGVVALIVIGPKDLPEIADRLELFQDEWGYLLLWATLAIACVSGLVLIAIPVVFGWRTAFGRYPGKAQTIVYFACLGFGYITVEVGLIAQFIQALSNATVSASVLITGMLVFSSLARCWWPTAYCSTPYSTPSAACPMPCAWCAALR